MKRGLLINAVAAALVTVLSGGCGSSGGNAPSAGPAVMLRLGYTSYLADAPALVGLQMGFFGAGPGRVTVVSVPFVSVTTEAAVPERHV